MTDKNTMSILQYILLNFISLVIEGFICIKYIFPLLSFNVRKDILLLIIILSIAVTTGGMMITYDKRRNHFSVFINTITPIVILILVMSARMYTGIHTVLTICAVTLSLCYTYLVYKHRPKSWDRDSHKRILDSCRRRSFLGCRTIVTLFLIILTGITAVQRVSAVSNMTAISKEVEYDFSDYTIEKKRYSLNILSADKWYSLSRSDKISALNTVKYIELNTLGIDHDVKFICKELGAHTLGAYQEYDGIIFLNEDYLDTIDVERWVENICHEVWHAKEHQLCRLYETAPEQYRNMPEFRNVPTYQYEFANYISGDSEDPEQIEAYMNQRIEYEARQYAESAIRKYYEFIYQ